MEGSYMIPLDHDLYLLKIMEPRHGHLYSPSLDLAAIWKDLKSIFDASFPIEEKDPWELVKRINKKLKNDFYSSPSLTYGLFDPQFKLLSFAMYYYCTKQQLLLGYIATRATQREKGYGSILFKASIKDLFNKNVKGVFLEIERVDLATSKEDADLRQRRRSWWFRMGARVLNGISYVQPSVDRGQPDIPMELLYIGSDPNQRFFEAEKYIKWLTACYKKAYMMSNTAIKKYEPYLKQVETARRMHQIQLVVP